MSTAPMNPDSLCLGAELAAPRALQQHLPEGRKRLTQGQALAPDPPATTAAPPIPTMRDLEDQAHGCPRAAGHQGY